jgi:anthranilate/para-aminobenzoate synthase component I
MHPLIQEIDTAHTPELLVEQLHGERGIVLLRSNSFDSPQARYSFVTANPFLTFRSFGSRCEIASDESQIANRKSQIQNCFVIAHTKIPAGENFADVSVMPHDAEAFARALYAELHRCDAAGAELIVVEAPPDSPEWSGIADRLRRAAA